MIFTCQPPSGSTLTPCPLTSVLVIPQTVPCSCCLLCLLFLSLYKAEGYLTFGALLNQERHVLCAKSPGAAWTDFVQMPALPQTSHVTLGKALLLPGRGSLFCKLRLLTTALQGCCEDSSTKYGEFQLITVMTIISPVKHLGILLPPHPTK